MSVRPVGALDRRALLGWGVAGTALALTGGTAAAASPAAAMEVFKLDADWGYPRGPHGKRRLVSRASRRAAAYRFALDPVSAEAMNLHRGSHAPAVPVTVSRIEFSGLWDRYSYRWTNPWTGTVVQIIDLRHALADPVYAVQGQAVLAAALGSGPDPHELTARGQLPATGSNPFGVLTGAILLAAGAGLSRFSRRVSAVRGQSVASGS